MERLDVANKGPFIQFIDYRNDVMEVSARDTSPDVWFIVKYADGPFIRVNLTPVDQRRLVDWLLERLDCDKVRPALVLGDAGGPKDPPVIDLEQVRIKHGDHVWPGEALLHVLAGQRRLEEVTEVTEADVVPEPEPPLPRSLTIEICMIPGGVYLADLTEELLPVRRLVGKVVSCQGQKLPSGGVWSLHGYSGPYNRGSSLVADKLVVKSDGTVYTEGSYKLRD